MMNETVFRDILTIAENELDWPHLSSATGYKNSTLEGHPVGPVDSGYLRTRKRNLCTHRDYQNLGVNGARSSSMLSNIIHSMARNQTFDHPAAVSYALIGNDVCNGRPWDSGTPPAEFYGNVVGALDFLDQHLPAGSRVIFIGLVDGRILYNTMGKRVHPIGSLHNNVLYSDFYDFLNCLGISPCWGWMNSDEKARNFTTQNAMKLNEVLKQVATNTSYKNFDIHYFDCPLQATIDMWTKQGGQVWQLIEPVDGFHPTQIADAIATEVLWEQYEQEDLLAPINPNNDLILKLFGDQGGYTPRN